MNEEHRQFCSESHLRCQGVEKGAEQMEHGLIPLAAHIPPLFTLWYPGYSKMKVITSSFHVFARHKRSFIETYFFSK